MTNMGFENNAVQKNNVPNEMNPEFFEHRARYLQTQIALMELDYYYCTEKAKILRGNKFVPPMS